jgi:hypothetical protein
VARDLAEGKISPREADGGPEHAAPSRAVTSAPGGGA